MYNYTRFLRRSKQHKLLALHFTPSSFILHKIYQIFVHLVSTTRHSTSYLTVIHTLILLNTDNYCIKCGNNYKVR